MPVKTNRIIYHILIKLFVGIIKADLNNVGDYLVVEHGVGERYVHHFYVLVSDGNLARMKHSKDPHH